MKKIYFLIAVALLAVGQVWAETARISNREWSNDNRNWSGSHVTFTFGGDGTSYYNAAIEANAYLTITGGNEYTISWNVDECYTINVTSLDIRLGHNGMVNVFKWEDCDIYVNGALVETIGTTTGSEKSYSGYSLGNNDHFTLKTSRDINIYWLQITYTITPNTYSIAFHADDATSGEMANQIFAYDVAQNLSTNAFVRAYTVNYDADGGECAEESAVADYVFAGWATEAEGEVVYADGQNVNNLTKEDGAVIDLYAIWNSVSVTLPEPTKEGLLFNGWYDGENYIGKAGDVITPETDINLTAHWADKLTPQFSLDKTEIELDQIAVLTLTNVDEPEITFAPEGIVDYNAETGELTGIALGEVAITISQAAKGVIDAKEETLNLTVVKKTPSLTVLLNGQERNTVTIHMEENATVAFEQVSDAEVEVELVSGEGVASYEEGVISALGIGNAVFRASLAETDTYQSISTEFTVVVALVGEINECYLVNDAEVSEWNTISNSKTYEFAENVPGAILTFEARRVAMVGFSNNTNFFAQTSADGSNWTDLFKMNVPETDTWYSFEHALPEDARYVRFATKTGSTGYRSVQNVKVTRKTWLKAEDLALQALAGEECTGAIKIDYSIANGGDLKIVCDNEKFVLESSTIENVECKGGVATIHVSYPSAQVGEDVAHVVIYNAVYRKEITLTATINPNPDAPATYGEYTAEFCEGDSVEFAGVWYYEPTVEPIPVVLEEKNLMGGDSIINLTILIREADFVEIYDTMAIGDILVLETEDWFLISGEELIPIPAGETPLEDAITFDITATFVDELGCDSVVVRHIVVEDKAPTGMETVQNDEVQSTKILRDGVLYIRRGEGLYTIEGKRVK